MKKNIILADNLIRNEIKDSQTNERKLLGKVNIIVRDVNTKQVINEQISDNLIVYSGREIIAQIIDRKDRTAGSGEKDYGIYWMSFGSGGVDPTNPNVPIPPQANDVALANEIVVDAGNAAYADGGRKLPITNTGKQYLTDPVNDNKYLIMKRTVLLGKDEGNGNNISEAGLWFSPSESPSETNFVLGSRLTFNSIPKTNNIEILFIWFWFV